MKPDPARLFCVVMSLLVATLVAAHFTSHTEPVLLLQPLASIPKEMDGFRCVREESLSPELLALLAPTEYLSRVYTGAADHIETIISYYAIQRPGETTHSPSSCLPGSGWEIISQETVPLRGLGEGARMNRFLVQRIDQQKAILYWYQSKSRVIADEFEAKWSLFEDSLLKHTTARAVVFVSVENTPRAVNTGIRFSASLAREVQQRISR